MDRLLEGAHVPELERVVAAARRDVTVVVAERDARGVAALGVRVGHLHRRADERLPVVPHLEKRLFKIQTLYLNTRGTEEHRGSICASYLAIPGSIGATTEVRTEKGPTNFFYLSSSAGQN